jgi:hypothetical protein
VRQASFQDLVRTVTGSPSRVIAGSKVAYRPFLNAAARLAVPKSGSKTSERRRTFVGRDSAANVLIRNGRDTPKSEKNCSRINKHMLTLNQRVQGSSPCAPTNKTIIQLEKPTSLRPA